MLVVFRRSGKTELSAKRLLWNSVASGPSRFLGAGRRHGWVLYRWETEFGEVVLAHTVRGEMGMTFPNHALLRELAEGAVALAVVEPDYGPPEGPSLEVIDAAGPDEYYGTTWRRLERVLGMPAPYWHSNLRDPDLMVDWNPGAPVLHVPAVVTPDPEPLLRLAAEEPDGSHAAVAALALAREAVWDCAEAARREIAEYVDASDAIASIAVAARPLMPHPPQPVAEEVLRDGWRTVLSRTDVLAARCAALGQALGVSRYFPGVRKVTVDLQCAQARQWASRLVSSPRTALAFPLGAAEGDILIDPVTDMPAIRTSEGMVETVAPQRLPAHSPLATLTIGRGSVWVTTEDGTVFVAPQVGGGYTYGYGGGGPMALARLIDLLLKDTTHAAPGHDGQLPSAGLRHATEVGWKGRTPPFTLTRSELEALRDA
ncbi:hypothetical protein [Streptomyces botrytidirepellens]|uniref:Uncharacterized protein n=1 Tax=Streptomyces botrytidirepellens TaxID=2486417 RepID=A0A3M8XAB4_9ACTN|nr:hypothetical protein [Streptomyces botrytidirepellens]RNG37373.1 hypothetical protein EEJ42_02310 [Streptomyces botrytidirepellens]